MNAFWDKLKKGKEKAEEQPAVSDASKGAKDDAGKKDKPAKPEVAEKEQKQEAAKGKSAKEEKELKKEDSAGKEEKQKKPKKKDKKKGFPKEQAVLISETIIRPKVSEAAMNQQALAKYVFYVKSGATKNEVAKAVQAMYGKQVRKVNIINYSPQKRTFRGYAGTVKGYKKAIVSLEKGQSIDVFSE